MTWTQGIPERVELQVGQRWRAELRSGAGGGYMWTVTPGDGAAGVATCEVVVGPVPPPGDPPDAVLAPLWLEVTALAPGEAAFSLRLARPWDPQDVLAQTSLVVQVR